MQQPATRDHDSTMEGLAEIIAKAYDKDDALQEGILILWTQKEDKGWYLVEIDKIYPDEIEVTYYATPRPSLGDYETSPKEQRMEALGEACFFRKTWYIRQGKNAGMATNKAPFSRNPELRLWKGKLPLTEREDLILAIGITLDHKGLLSKGYN